jgi:hypothetical protein
MVLSHQATDIKKDADVIRRRFRFICLYGHLFYTYRIP